MQQSTNFHTQKNDEQTKDTKRLNDKNVTTFKCNGALNDSISLPCPPLISMVAHGDLDKSDLCELRNRMISQKWLLSRWITLKERELESKCKNITTEIKLLHRSRVAPPANGSNVSPNSHFDTLTNLILSKSKRVQFTGGINPQDDRESIRYGPCCFSTEDSNDSTIECPKPALPFTRHCKKHILYNVDQLLFERCAAKSTTSPLTQCSHATFCIEKDRKPLCTDHQKLLLTSGVPSNDDKEVSTISGKGRKRAKSNLVTRSTRRKTNTKGKGKGKGKGDAPETVTSTASIASVSAAAAVNLCDSTAASYNMIDVELMSTNTESTVPPLHPVVTANHDLSSNTYPLGVDANGDIPTGLDVDIHNLTAGDEALVASLVEDLPPLGTSADEVVVGDANSSHAFDADFTEVLNKLPPEAFNEIFSTTTSDNHHSHSQLNHQTPQISVTVSPNVTLSSVTTHQLTNSLHHQRTIQSSHHLSAHHAVNKVPNSESSIDTIVMDVDSNLFSPRVNSHLQHHSHSHAHSHNHQHHHQQPQQAHLSHPNSSHLHHHPSASHSVIKDCSTIVNGTDGIYSGYLPSNTLQNAVIPAVSPCSNGITPSSASNATLVVHSHVPDVNPVVNTVTVPNNSSNNINGSSNNSGNSVSTVSANSHRITTLNNNPSVLPSNLANLLMSRSMSINSSAINSPQTPVQVASVASHTTTGAPVSTLPQVNDDLCGLATNILGCLTKEQQQQLNGLIDGALASGSLSSSPTL